MSPLSLPSTLKLKTGFTSCVCQRFNTAAEFKTAAVKHDLRNAFVFCAPGNQFTNQFCLVQFLLASVLPRKSWSMLEAAASVTPAWSSITWA